MTTVFFIRHGHSDHNEAFDNYGEDAYGSHEYLNSSLTSKGIIQAKNVKLNTKVKRVYCSSLKRCIQTARIIFGPHETLYLYDGLMETQGPYPCNTRQSYDDIQMEYENINMENVSKSYEQSNNHEAQYILKARVISTLMQIQKDAVKNNIDTIAIVSHNDVLESQFGRKFQNCEVYRTIF
jgi:broad specificity phosphatase PhoE